MKNIHYIAIVVVLVVVVGLFIMSPFSPLNKATIHGKPVKLAPGYTVKDTGKNSLTVSNGTNTLKLYLLNYTSVDEGINSYKAKFNETHNITQADIPTNNGEKIIKTKAKETNGTGTIYKYWFAKGNKVYNIQTNNAVADTDNVAKTMISSMN